MKRILSLLSTVVVCLFALCLVSCVSSGKKAGLPVFINEVSYGNGIQDTEPGYIPAFIEFGNSTGKDLSLDGYFLGYFVNSDEENLYKYTLSGYSVPANGYLVIDLDTSLLPKDMALSGVELLLSNRKGKILQHVIVPPIDEGTTYSLQPDGSWQITDSSPLAENPVGVPYVVSAPEFSYEAGFYDESFSLELDADVTCRIYYTTDGSVPDRNSIPYTGPIVIEDATSNPNTLSMRTDIVIDGATPPDATLKKATIISAVAIDEQGNRSDVMTKAYFIGFHNYREYLSVPIVSIVADPSDLFDAQDGIYVLGKLYQDWLESGGSKSNTASRSIPTNYRREGSEWVIPASVQEFDADGNYLFTQEALLGINEDSSHDKTQKPFDLYARIVDGDFQDAFIPGTEHKEKYILRTTPGKDSIVHELLERLGLTLEKFQPCLCFLNGEFWGFYELWEDADGEFISDRYGVDRDNLILVENNVIEEGESLLEGLEFYLEEVGITEALNLFFSTLDTSTEEGCEIAEQVIDVENFLTYVVANVFFNNCDFQNSYIFWRTASPGYGKYNDGRLRWVINDMDQSFQSIKSKSALVMMAENPVFISLWNNESFRTRFFTMVMDFANVLYTADAVREYVTEKLGYYNPYYRATSERFMESDTASYNYARNLKSTILNFLSNRRTELISQCAATLSDVRDTQYLTVEGLTSDTKLYVNGYLAYHKDSTWEGVYFSGCEVTLEVRPIPGYKFCGWYAENTLLTDKYVITVSTDLGHRLTPVFEAIPVVAVMDRINYARSNYRGGYELYTLNYRSHCVIIPDAALKSSVDFMAIELSSDGEWNKGTGFTITFPTTKLFSCGMILWLTETEGCPENWKLFFNTGDGKKVELSCDSEPTEDGLKLFFELPDSCIGLPEVELHMESAGDCAGGTVRITKISLYGYDS